MKPPHIVCQCGREFLFGEGFEAHARDDHGLLRVRLALGGFKWVPIMSHPEQKD